MYIKPILIGDHLVRMASNSMKLIRFFDLNYENHPNGHDQKPDLSIIIQEGYGIPFVDYVVSITKEANHMVFSRSDYLLKVDHDYQHAVLLVHNELSLKHALMNLYSCFIVYHKWGLMLHSSCVEENGGSHVFAGPSGAGKSTAAKLSHPRALLSDEATIVRITPDAATIMNSPFRSELDAEGSNPSIPLSSIHILHQALYNQRIPLKKSDAYLHLIDKIFYWAADQAETRKVMELLLLLVKQVPVYELHFQNNNTFWELIS